MVLIKSSLFFLTLLIFSACGGGYGSSNYDQSPGNAPTGNVSGQVELVETT